MDSDYDYDVALSYAGEDSIYVEDVAKYLEKFEVKVFFAPYKEAELWGKNLTEHLPVVYKDKSQYAVIFISKHYAEKALPTLEARATFCRELEQDHEYILPARFDDTKIPGLLPDKVWQNLKEKTPFDLALLICEKLGKNVSQIKDSDVLPPQSTNIHDEVTFNYTNHNGAYVLGEGNFEFKTRWSKASGDSIHCGNSYLKGVALGLNIESLSALTDVSIFNFTSNWITVREGEYCVIKNQNNLYCVIQVIDILDHSRDDERDELKIKYWISKQPLTDFSKVQDLN